MELTAVWTKKDDNRFLLTVWETENGVKSVYTAYEHENFKWLQRQAKKMGLPYKKKELIIGEEK